jgi:RNA polymerase sigma-70 factor (ECF subfamily)
MSMKSQREESAAEAVGRLVASDGARMYGLALKLCRNPAEAEDLVQDTFLQAYRKWDQFEGRSEPTSWLYTIAARLCRRRQRRRSGEPRHVESLSDLLPSRDATVARIPSDDDSPLDEQLRREAQERVERALAELSVRLRLPLVLKDIAELSVAEVADILGLKEATVKTRVHRARLALRHALTEVLPRQPSPPPDHSRRVCLDLLHAKQEALDRGVEFPVPQDELCSRCQSLLSTLDLSQQLCRHLDSSQLPSELKGALAARLVRPSRRWSSREALDE